MGGNPKPLKPKTLNSKLYGDGGVVRFESSGLMVQDLLRFTAHVSGLRFQGCGRV